MEIRPGSRVQVILPQINRAHDAGKLYPHLMMGTVADKDPQGNSSFDKAARLAYVRYDNPFRRQVREQDEDGKRRNTVKLVHADWVPVWLLVLQDDPAAAAARLVEIRQYARSEIQRGRKLIGTFAIKAGEIPVLLAAGTIRKGPFGHCYQAGAVA